MIHLYAFVSGLRSLPADAELEYVRVGPVTAVAGRLPDGARADSEDDVIRHGLVVESLVECAEAVLPARFGERFADVAALEATMRSHARSLERQLGVVRGCVEVVVRVTRARRAADSVAGDGSAYMRMRLRAVATDQAAADELHADLNRHARAASVSSTPSASLVYEAGYLVERDAVDELAGAARTYAAAHPELTVVCTGPWAPSSFAGAA
jgi:hypothetical protein